MQTTSSFKDIIENQDYKPQLHDVTRYFYNVKIDGKFVPVHGEESNCLMVFLAYVMMKTPAIIESYSGGGKSCMANAVLSLIPEEEKYSIELGSDKSVWYDREKINEKSFVYAPELQKCMQNLDVRELLKNWGEGKTAERKVAISIFGQEDSVREQTINWHPFLSTFALENKDAFIDEELRRRVVTIHTDCSRKQTREVLKNKLQRVATPHKMMTMDEKEIMKLRLHILHILGQTKEKMPSFLNPFAPILHKSIPDVFTISRSYIDYLINVINGSALFHLKERFKFKDMIVVAPQDNWFALRIYGTQFFESCLKIPMLGKEVLKMFPKKIIQGEQILDECFLEVNQVQQKMKEAGYLLESGKIRAILGLLTMSGYLEEALEGKEKKKRYCLGNLSSDWSTHLEWEREIKNVKEFIQKEYPGMYEEYDKKYCQNLTITDPINGERINLLELKSGRNEDINNKNVRGMLDEFIKC